MSANNYSKAIEMARGAKRVLMVEENEGARGEPEAKEAKMVGLGPKRPSSEDSSEEVSAKKRDTEVRKWLAEILEKVDELERMEVGGPSASRLLIRRKATDNLSGAPEAKRGVPEPQLAMIGEEDEEEEEEAEEQPTTSRLLPSQFEVPIRLPGRSRMELHTLRRIKFQNELYDVQFESERGRIEEETEEEMMLFDEDLEVEREEVVEWQEEEVVEEQIEVEAERMVAAVVELVVPAPFAVVHLVAQQMPTRMVAEKVEVLVAAPMEVVILAAEVEPVAEPEPAPAPVEDEPQHAAPDGGEDEQENEQGVDDTDEEEEEDNDPDGHIAFCDHLSKKIDAAFEKIIEKPMGNHLDVTLALRRCRTTLRRFIKKGTTNNHLLDLDMRIKAAIIGL